MTPPPRAATVVLASMPFGMLQSPSLALGILQARLEAAGVTTVCHHFTLDYAERIGVAAYQRIAAGYPGTTSLLGEWIFSHALAPATGAQQQAYLRQVFGSGPAQDGEELRLRDQVMAQVLALAADAASFVDRAAHAILAHAPRVVALTSVFEQNLATLALAQRLRALAPGLRIVLGGANCEGAMGRELARRYPFMDVVVSGEGDHLVVPLVACLARGDDWRQDAALAPLVDGAASDGNFLQARMVRELSDQPRPVFEAWFDQLARHPRVAAGLSVEIPLESSRGCWWGEKHHCTFCGLNGATMAFRSRPPQQVLQDIQAYAARHPGHRLAFVDNIMERGYFDTLLPQLARARPGTELFYEIKSNVTRAQVRALRDGGVRHVQPGIESLSDHVLALMQKGVGALQNLQLLKWAMEYGVRVDWNLLWGFPGETADDYRAMASLLPWLVHLQPPARGARIRLDRHSPLFQQARAFGFRGLRPAPAYGFVHRGLPPEALDQLAYFFEADHDLDAAIDGYTRPLADAIALWQQQHAGSVLFHLEHADTLVVIDGRPHLPGRTARVLPPLQARLLLLCDRARSATGLARDLPDTGLQRIAEALEALRRERLVWSDGRRFLALTVSLATFLASRRGARVERELDALLAA